MQDGLNQITPYCKREVILAPFQRARICNFFVNEKDFLRFEAILKHLTGLNEKHLDVFCI